MKISFLYAVLAILFQIQLSKCKNILAIFPHMGMSHFIMFEAYVEKLAERGHSLTLLTWLNVTHLHKNVKTISFGDEAFHFGVNLAEQEATPKFARIWSEMQFLNNIGEKACSTGLSNIKVKELIKSKQHFDLVVVEFFNTDCFSVFAHFFNAPIIGISSSTLLPWHNDRMGNPDNPSYIVTAFSGYQSEMDFFSRLINTFNLLFAKTYYKMFINGKTDKIIKGNLGKGIPKVSDIVSRTSLYLANSHFSLFQPRPTAPGVIEVGGLHVPQPQRLPPDLDTYLSNSKNGVVYFSMGSLIDSSTLPAKKKKLILNVFGNLTQNVLWKWQTDEMPEKKKNMLVKKWFPQNDVLANPNVKVFVTHGGLMSVLEAVTHGVPMIILPVFGDQFYNAALLAEKGSGIVLDYFSLTEEKFLQAIKKILEDKRYAENAKLLSAKFKERPLSAMNSAIYWTEYVLKFKGAPHLKPANNKLSWFNEFLLDVVLFVGILSFLIVHFGKKALVKWNELKKDEKSKKKKK